MGYKAIEEYGLVGDLHTVALVGDDGSIDFMCFPDFDSPSIFCAILDDKKGGRFKIGPVETSYRHKQIYRPDSNILLTRFLGDLGICEVSDFMAVDEEEHPQRLVRRAKAIRGAVRFSILIDPRFDYGRASHTLEKRENEYLFIPDKEHLPVIRILSEVELQCHEGKLVQEVVLEEGKSFTIILEEGLPHQPSEAHHPEFESKAFKTTLNFWHQWIGHTHYQGRWREMVNRSALTLKLLTSKKYGSIVAAPTFGLPEGIGGVRNWDYRYTWIRDASFTLYALIRLGYVDEAAAFMQWIEDRCCDLNPDGSLQIMYCLDGRKEIPEEELTHFEGYKQSRPVRIGNAAYKQSQLDIYGELMDSIYLYNKYGQPISNDLWENIVRLINWLCDHWDTRDQGIWEIRGGPQKFLYSRVMCWVALDRAIRLSRKRSFPAPLQKWFEVRDRIYHTIIREYWNPKKQAFVQYHGSDTLDASALLMPLIKFISPTDPKWLSTLSAIDHDLVVDSLVYRYNTDADNVDGLSGGEGTFNMCSFWYVECLSRAGDVKQARFFFEKILGYASPLGLFAEELGPDGHHLGNYPQAFTHLALISAATNIDYNLNRRHINW